MTTTKKWSQEAWEAAAPVYEKIKQLPFIQELAAGTLPEEKFIFYLQQDSIYIKNYSKVLAHIASRLQKFAHTDAFLHFALDGVAAEQATQEGYLAPFGDVKVDATPTCLLYMSLLSAQATAPVEVEAAGILPCFWVYYAIGKYLGEIAVQSNPYGDWIGAYNNEYFDNSNALCIDICDQLAENTTPEIRQQMTDIYVMATKMEYLFWKTAYEKEQWPI